MNKKSYGHKGTILIISAVLLLFMGSCRKEQKAPTVKKPDTTAVKPLPPLKPELKIKYGIYATGDSAVVKRFVEAYTDTQRTIILSLNRIDDRNISINDTLILPDTFLTSLLPYSPFPKEIQMLDSVPKILLFSYPIEAFAAYDSGRLIRWGPTSMGKLTTPTPTGLFHTNWKSKETISTDNEEWILPWYFNLENKRGISIHQFALPGRPASHACARLRAEDAEWIYYWADQWIITADGESMVAYGTPVIIFGKYNFKEKPPWKAMPVNPDTAKYTKADLEKIIKEYMPLIKERQEARDSVIAARIRFNLTGGNL
ncbi:MAG TPA: L,D-transpeptidase [Ignavibacteriaceae bacterium]|nr:L,D-transpeptidase [Ignavibacteriaceae bacterium]